VLIKRCRCLSEVKVTLHMKISWPQQKAWIQFEISHAREPAPSYKLRRNETASLAFYFWDQHWKWVWTETGWQFAFSLVHPQFIREWSLQSCGLTFIFLSKCL
jgi:hypothetical protein